MAEDSKTALPQESDAAGGKGSERESSQRDGSHRDESRKDGSRRDGSRRDGSRRDHVIVRTSIIGIVTNLLLAGFKAGVGIVSGSVAVINDAINNLTDAVSSVVTIIGTKLAGRAPDRKHPLGHGRVEYLSAMIVAAIVGYAGITAMVESVKKIIHPEEPSYSTVTFVILGVAVAVKVLLGLYVRRVGKKTRSEALEGSGKDALSDAILSFSTIVAAVIYTAWGLSLEAYLGVVISLFIIKTAYEMLRSTISEILGERAAHDYTMQVKQAAAAVPGVQGVYDLILNNYGPDKYIASMHIEVDYSMTAKEIDEIIRGIEVGVYAATGAIVAGVSIYSVGGETEKVSAVRRMAEELVEEEPHALQMHGFRVEEDKSLVRFDVVVDFEAKDRMAVVAGIREKLEVRFPDYHFQILLDTDVSDV
ncbi:MAG: cation transporter [Clostridia bacterium]|nr:cation transporter [Clostridia bacterium]